MGKFYVGCKVENHKDGRSAVLPKLMVDTGSEFTWIDGKVLEEIGIERRKKDLQIQMANGQVFTRSVGYAILRVDQAETTDLVVFSEPGDLLVLGGRALEGLRLRVDSPAKRLVTTGPVVAATAVNLVFDLPMAS